LLARLASDPASGADPTFFSRRDYVSPGNVWVAIADTNGDHIPDLITGGLTVWLGNGNGTFSQGPISPRPGRRLQQRRYPGHRHGRNERRLAVHGEGRRGVQPRRASPIHGVRRENITKTLAAADFNGDGNLDLVVPTTTGFAVLLGNGNGTFSQETFTFPFPGPTVVGSIAIGDLNLDGHQDIALIPYRHSWQARANFVYVYLGDGKGASPVPRPSTCPEDGPSPSAT
jgi:hypothetical protein